MSADMLLTLNAGSSTAKIALFEAAPSGARRVAKGTIDFRKNPPSFRVTEGATTFDVNLKTDVSDIRGVIAETFTRLANHFDPAVSPAWAIEWCMGVTLSPVRCVSMTLQSKQSIS